MNARHHPLLRHFHPALLHGLLLLLLCMAQTLRAEPASYTFAVTPQFEQRKLIAIWSPIVAELEKRTGLSIQLTSMMSVPDFEKELVKASFDFVYCNPYNIIKSKPSPGYIPLVRDRSLMHGLVLVRKDSPLTGIADLEGKTVAFPSPNALGASLLVRADLARLHHVNIKPLYVKTHSSVYLHVVNGLADAGGGVETTLQEQEAAVRDAMRVLYTTREFPSLPVAANPRVPKADREKVRKALLELSATPEGKEMFERIPMPDPVATSLDDYAPMRSWGLESFWMDKY